MVDSKALKILFKRYWSPEGWTNTQLSKAELDYAKAAGVMFDQKEFSHDDIVQHVHTMVNALHLEDVAAQFVASLSTRRLDLRSALGSYIVGRHLINHSFVGKEDYCAYCGSYNKEREKDDLNVLNFERFKWGGVRHLDPLYIAFDLEQFSKTERLVPSANDYVILNDILSIIREFPAEGKIGELEKAITKVIKSNKAEREVLLQIFGFCSILATSEHPGFIDNFIPFHEREEPAHSKNDWSYPVNWWRGNDGLSIKAVPEIFTDSFPN